MALFCRNFSGFPSLRNAQPVVFTIDEAIQSALKNNRDIIIAKLNVEKADAAVSEAFGYALPSVNLSANFSHFLEKPKTAFPDFEALLQMQLIQFFLMKMFFREIIQNIFR